MPGRRASSSSGARSPFTFAAEKPADSRDAVFHFQTETMPIERAGEGGGMSAEKWGG